MYSFLLVHPPLSMPSLHIFLTTSSLHYPLVFLYEVLEPVKLIYSYFLIIKSVVSWGRGRVLIKKGHAGTMTLVLTWIIAVTNSLLQSMPSSFSLISTQHQGDTVKM